MFLQSFCPLLWFIVTEQLRDSVSDIHSNVLPIYRKIKNVKMSWSFCLYKGDKKFIQNFGKETSENGRPRRRWRNMGGG
jgi:hypothetical protein